jgi:hypothetical protein
MEKLRHDPALIRPAVEELLRFTSPVELDWIPKTTEEATLRVLITRNAGDKPWPHW